LYAGTASAQKAKVSIDKNNVPVSQLLSEIEAQTDYLFIINNQVDVRRLASLKLAGQPTSQALDAIFANTGVTYKLEGTHIVLSVKGGGNSDTPTENRISGRVTDKNGMPLVGASVIVKGSTIGMSTDGSGNYSIKAEPGQTLQVVYIGYQTREVQVGPRTVMDIVLDDADMMIDDVVVTALGIKREEKALSYSAQQVKAEDITAVRDANFVNALNGKIAGVTINTSASGIGGATRVVMRGPKSITKDNNAFYVIDGVPIYNVNGGALEENSVYNIQPRGEGISDLNPDDIESMTVLTGPSAAALYGANAANGAIIITTKKGRAGKPQITVSNQTTFSSAMKMHEFQNEYGNLPGVYSSWSPTKLSPEERTNYNPKNYFNTAVNMQSSVSLSVGTEKNQTYISLANVDADGLLENNKFEKNTLTFRNTTDFLEGKFTLDVGYSLILQKDQNMLSNGRFYNPLVSLYTYPRGEPIEDMLTFETYDPLQEIYVQNWKWGRAGYDMQNPMWMIHRNYQNNKKTRHMFNANLTYKVTDWLSLAGRIRVDHATNDFSRKLYASTIELFAVGSKGYYHAEKSEDTQKYADVMANINKRWGDFSFVANVGASISDMRYSTAGGKGALRIIPNFFSLPQIDPSGANSQVIQNRWREQTQSIFASVEVGWRSMLYLTVTGRNDWASPLANTSNSSFFYPSVGLSALIHEMLPMPEFVSFLKIRGSYASVGSAIPRNISIATLNYSAKTNQYAEKTIRPVSDLKPEMTSSWEIGLNAKLFNNKVNIDVTYYSSQTKDQTFLVPISSSSQYDQMYIQTGRVDNKGWELGIGYSNTWRGFAWNTHLTASTNKNKVVELASNYYDKESDSYISLDRIEQGGVESLQNWITVGGTIGDLWTTNDLARDENGFIHVVNDMPKVVTEYKKVGTTLPKWNLGWRNDFSWKNINLGFLISARFGGVVSSVTQAALDGLGVSKATADARNANGVKVNNGMMKAQNWYETIGQSMVLSRYIYKADNIRLQEISLGYTLPTKWFNDKLRITASFVGRNLFMIYCKAPFDPELTASTGTYFQGIDYFMQPSLRSLGFNVELKF
jgi:tonB-linked outer membrane protein, susC/ragA family